MNVDWESEGNCGGGEGGGRVIPAKFRPVLHTSGQTMLNCKIKQNLSCIMRFKHFQ